MVIVVERKGVSTVLCTFWQYGFTVTFILISHTLGKHATITPSASTSVTSERESGVGGVASDDRGGGGGTRGKHQSNDSSSKVELGSDSGRGVSPISSTDSQPNKGASTSNSRGGSRKSGATKSGKESSRSSGSSTSTTSSNDPHHPGGSLNPPHTRGDSITSRTPWNTTPPPTSTSQPNSTRLSHQALTFSSSSVSGKRGEGGVSKELPPTGKTQQQGSSTSRGKGNQSRSVG